MSSAIIADRDFPLCFIAGPNERAREANVLINAGYDRLFIAGRPAEANFEPLASTIGEAAKWTIEKSGTVSAPNAWRRP
jgi:hypothetical protein